MGTLGRIEKGRGQVTKWGIGTSGIGVVAFWILLGASGSLSESLWAQVREPLILREGEAREHQTGTARYKMIELGRGSTLVVVGTTELVIDRLVVDGEATIRYRKGARASDETKALTVFVTDASEVRGTLFVDGSGADGLDGGGGYAGRNGHGGECESIWWGLVSKLLTKRNPGPGDAGGAGENGSDGEKGMDLEVTLRQLDTHGYVRLRSNGGRGGHGGRGGNGGHGGSGRSACAQRGRPGGAGGTGGKGGNGGDAGQVNVRLTYQDGASDETYAELRALLDGNIEAIPGSGGKAGLGGDGGNGGDGGAGGSVEPFFRRSGGDGGAAGGPGSGGLRGDGTTPVKELLSESEELRRSQPLLERVFPTR